MMQGAMSTKRYLIFGAVTVLCMGLLVMTTTATPLNPGEGHDDNPALKLSLKGTASAPMIDGTRIDWRIIVTNTGTEALTNSVLVDILPDGLALNRIDFPRGQTTIRVDRQTITMTINRLEPGATAEIRLYTNTPRRNTTISNTVCVQASRLCATDSVAVPLSR